MKTKLKSKVLLLDAVRLIKKIKNEPSKSSKLKRDHYAQIGVVEVFLEATPSAFVFTILIVSTFTINDEGLVFILRGPLDGKFWGNVQFALFILSCGSSIFSAAFGVARWSRDCSLKY